jgi:hypothetical protein
MKGYFRSQTDAWQPELLDLTRNSGCNLGLEFWWWTGHYANVPAPPNGGEHRILTGSIGFMKRGGCNRSVSLFVG